MRFKLVIRNQAYHWSTVLPIVVFCGLFLLIAIESFSLVNRINFLSTSTLRALETDLIVQNEAKNQPGAITPRKLVVPPSLPASPDSYMADKIKRLPEVAGHSRSLTLWQMSPKGKVVFVGLDPSEPPIGAAKARDLLYKGRFFDRAQADEVVFERHFAMLFNLKPGDKYQVAGRTLAVVGLVDFKDSSNLANAAAFIPYRTALELSGFKRPVANQWYLRLTRATDAPRVQEALSRQLPGIKVITQDSLLKNLTGLNSLMLKFGAYFLAFVAFMSGFAIFMGLRFYTLDFDPQRQILRALGWGRSDLRKWMATEIAVLLAMAAGLAAIGHLAVGGALNQYFY